MDNEKISTLIANASTASGIKRAQTRAKKAWPPFPHNGCAANLSALLQIAGMDVPMILGAGKLAFHLEKTRGWGVIDVGQQMPGDVGVTFDEGGNPGADHIYLLLEVRNRDEMLISDNQATSPHVRFASGKGRTPTEYFLRAP
jgi:hypothetical protein